MPINVDRDWPSGLIRTRVRNPLGLDDVRSHLRTLRETRAFTFPELVDARDLSGRGVSTRDLKSVAWTARTLFGQGVIADRAVVVRGDAAFRSARFVATLVTGCVRLGVFSEEDDAEHWLEESQEWALPAGAEYRPKPT